MITQFAPLTSCKEINESDFHQAKSSAYHQAKSLTFASFSKMGLRLTDELHYAFSRKAKVYINDLVFGIHIEAIVCFDGMNISFELIEKQ